MRIKTATAAVAAIAISLSMVVIGKNPGKDKRTYGNNIITARTARSSYTARTARSSYTARTARSAYTANTILLVPVNSIGKPSGFVV